MARVEKAEEMATNKAKAYDLLEHGIEIVPIIIANKEKKPTIKWKEHRLTTKEAIDGHWYDGRDPQPYVGWIHEEYGAIDIDVKDGKNGFETLERAGLELPETPVWYDTPSGGRHYIYKFPKGTTENVDIVYNGVKLSGVDRRIGNGLAIWYGEVPPFEQWLNVPDAPTWAYAFEKVELPSTKPKSPQDWFDALPKGEIGPEIRKILDYVSRLSESEFGHNAVRDAMYAIVSEGAKGQPGAIDALNELQAMWLRPPFDIEKHKKDWNATLLGLIDKIPEFEAKAVASKVPVDEQAEANRKELIRLNAQEWAKEQKRKERYKGIEICDWDELENTTIEWVIDGVWYFDSLNALVGRSQIGKTFVAASMAGSVAMGIKWFGRDVIQGKVLYIAGEGFKGIAKRFKSWCTHNKQDWEILKKNLKVVRGADLMSEDSVDEIRKLCGELEPVLVIVDTLSATSSIDNENDAAEMRDLLLKIASIYPLAAKVAVHHPNDATRYSQKPKARGSGAFKSNADNLMTVTLDDSFEPSQEVTDAAGGRPRFLTLSTDDNEYEGKSKESEPITIKGMYLRETDAGVSLAQANGTKQHADYSTVKQVMEFLENKGQECTSAAFWAAADSLGLKNANDTGWKVKAAARRMLDKAVMRGELQTKVGANRETIYVLSKLPDLRYLNGLSM